MLYSYSLEVRWFGEGELSTDKIHWIMNNGCGYGKQQGHRQDIYLRIPYDGLGTKFRDEEDNLPKMELKRREKEYGLFNRGPFQGQMASWEKWSGKADTMPPKVFPWIEVDKVRHVLKFEWTEKNGSKPTSLSNMPDCGCTVEATDLTIRNAPWWTIGFEAFGDPNHSAHNVLNALELAMQHMAGTAPSGLVQTCSYDYPEWLMRLPV